MSFVLSIFFIAIVGFLSYFFFVDKMDFSMPIVEPEVRTERINNLVKSMDFSKINPEFLFSAEIPNEFEAEYIPQLKAINIYNPNLQGNNTEKSQIYISFFKANRFLTLSTVEITQQDKVVVKGRDAILYEITKKPEVPDFAGQPSWRNLKHKAIDVRFTKNNPSLFYSSAYNPNFSEELFNNFINSLTFYDEK